MPSSRASTVAPFLISLWSNRPISWLGGQSAKCSAPKSIGRNLADPAQLHRAALPQPRAIWEGAPMAMMVRPDRPCSTLPGAGTIRSARAGRKRVDKHVNYTNRVVLVDAIIQVFGKQRRLPAIHPLDKALHRDLPPPKSRQNCIMRGVFTQPGAILPFDCGRAAQYRGAAASLEVAVRRHAAISGSRPGLRGRRGLWSGRRFG
jgi:hypothetical protein